MSAATLALAAAAGCGSPQVAVSTSGSGSSPAATPGTVTVVVKNLAFNPTAVTIPVGGKVVWSFQDGTVPHTVTSDANLFGSPPNGQTSGTFEHVFTSAGTFAYHCDFHAAMTATVNVR